MLYYSQMRPVEEMRTGPQAEDNAAPGDVLGAAVRRALQARVAEAKLPEHGRAALMAAVQAERARAARSVRFDMDSLLAVPPISEDLARRRSSMLLAFAQLTSPMLFLMR